MNSPGFEGAAPISAMTCPTLTVSGGLVVALQRTKKAWASVAPSSFSSSH